MVILFKIRAFVFFIVILCAAVQLSIAGNDQGSKDVEDPKKTVVVLQDLKSSECRVEINRADEELHEGGVSKSCRSFFQNIKNNSVFCGAVAFSAISVICISKLFSTQTQINSPSTGDANKVHHFGMQDSLGYAGQDSLGYAGIASANISSSVFPELPSVTTHRPTMKTTKITNKQRYTKQPVHGSTSVVSSTGSPEREKIMSSVVGTSLDSSTKRAVTTSITTQPPTEEENQNDNGEIIGGAIAGVGALGSGFGGYYGWRVWRSKVMYRQALAAQRGSMRMSHRVSSVYQVIDDMDVTDNIYSHLRPRLPPRSRPNVEEAWIRSSRHDFAEIGSVRRPGGRSSIFRVSAPPEGGGSPRASYFILEPSGARRSVVPVPENQVSRASTGSTHNYFTLEPTGQRTSVYRMSAQRASGGADPFYFKLEPQRDVVQTEQISHDICKRATSSCVSSATKKQKWIKFKNKLRVLSKQTSSSALAKTKIIEIPLSKKIGKITTSNLRKLTSITKVANRVYGANARLFTRYFGRMAGRMAGKIGGLIAGYAFDAILLGADLSEDIPRWKEQTEIEREIEWENDFYKYMGYVIWWGGFLVDEDIEIAKAMQVVEDKKDDIIRFADSVKDNPLIFSNAIENLPEQLGGGDLKESLMRKEFDDGSVCYRVVSKTDIKGLSDDVMLGIRDGYAEIYMITKKSSSGLEDLVAVGSLMSIYLQQEAALQDYMLKNSAKMTDMFKIYVKYAFKTIRDVDAEADRRISAGVNNNPYATGGGAYESPNDRAKKKTWMIPIIEKEKQEMEEESRKRIEGIIESIDTATSSIDVKHMRVRNFLAEFSQLLEGEDSEDQEEDDEYLLSNEEIFNHIERIKRIFSLNVDAMLSPVFSFPNISFDYDQGGWLSDAKDKMFVYDYLRKVKDLTGVERDLFDDERVRPLLYGGSYKYRKNKVGLEDCSFYLVDKVEPTVRINVKAKVENLLTVLKEGLKFSLRESVGVKGGVHQKTTVEKNVLDDLAYMDLLKSISFDEVNSLYNAVTLKEGKPVVTQGEVLDEAVLPVFLVSEKGKKPSYGYFFSPFYRYSDGSLRGYDSEYFDNQKNVKVNARVPAYFGGRSGLNKLNNLSAKVESKGHLNEELDVQIKFTREETNYLLLRVGFFKFWRNENIRYGDYKVSVIFGGVKKCVGRFSVDRESLVSRDKRVLVLLDSLPGMDDDFFYVEPQIVYDPFDTYGDGYFSEERQREMDLKAEARRGGCGHWRTCQMAHKRNLFSYKTITIKGDLKPGDYVVHVFNGKRKVKHDFEFSVSAHPWNMPLEGKLYDEGGQVSDIDDLKARLISDKRYGEFWKGLMDASQYEVPFISLYKKEVNEFERYVPLKQACFKDILKKRMHINNLITLFDILRLEDLKLSDSDVYMLLAYGVGLPNKVMRFFVGEHINIKRSLIADTSEDITNSPVGEDVAFKRRERAVDYGNVTSKSCKSRVNVPLVVGAAFLSGFSRKGDTAGISTGKGRHAQLPVALNKRSIDQWLHTNSKLHPVISFSVDEGNKKGGGRSMIASLLSYLLPNVEKTCQPICSSGCHGASCVAENSQEMAQDGLSTATVKDVISLFGNMPLQMLLPVIERHSEIQVMKRNFKKHDGWREEDCFEFNAQAIAPYACINSMLDCGMGMLRKQVLDSCKAISNENEKAKVRDWISFVLQGDEKTEIIREFLERLVFFPYASEIMTILTTHDVVLVVDVDAELGEHLGAIFATGAPCYQKLEALKKHDILDPKVKVILTLGSFFCDPRVRSILEEHYKSAALGSDGELCGSGYTGCVKTILRDKKLRKKSECYRKGVAIVLDRLMDDETCFSLPDLLSSQADFTGINTLRKFHQFWNESGAYKIPFILYEGQKHDAKHLEPDLLLNDDCQRLKNTFQLLKMRKDAPDYVKHGSFGQDPEDGIDKVKKLIERHISDQLEKSAGCRQ